jgi:hypothetical protein
VAGGEQRRERKVVSVLFVDRGEALLAKSA